MMFVTVQPLRPAACNDLNACHLMVEPPARVCLRMDCNNIMCHWQPRTASNNLPAITSQRVFRGSVAGGRMLVLLTPPR